MLSGINSSSDNASKRLKYALKLDFLHITIKIFIVIFLFSVFLVFDLAFLPPFKHKIQLQKIIVIKEGLNLKEIGNILKENKIIKSPFLFNLTVKFMDGEKTVKAGEYLFDKPYSDFEVAKKIVDGEYGIEKKKILIKEGGTLEEIGALLEKEGLFKKEELYLYTGCCAGKIFPQNKIESAEFNAYDILTLNNNLEGFFFPDTYYFPINITAQNAVKMVLKNFDNKVFLPFKEEIEESGRDFYEILIVASILEKEAITYEDKRMVADVIWRRLEKRMPLQVDASLQYAFNKNTFQLTKADLRVDSPYNTYRHKNLPITPISNPGLESIKAAINPIPNPYWFYMSDKYNIIYYSETYNDHEEKVTMYLREMEL